MPAHFQITCLCVEGFVCVCKVLCVSKSLNMCVYEIKFDLFIFLSSLTKSKEETDV